MMTRKKPLWNRAVSPGFTLIELLTVIAIIGILAAILIPVVGRVREHAKRAKDASHLHQWGLAHSLYRDDHNGNYMNSGQGDPKPHWVSAADRDLLIESYGVEWEMFFCPSNDAYNATWMTEEQRTSGSSIPMGYFYLPGQNLPGFESAKDPLEYDLLMVDIVRTHASDGGGFGSIGINHAEEPGIPAGAHHLRVDGSVQWIDASEFMDDGGYQLGSVRAYFRNPYQPDTGPPSR